MVLGFLHGNLMCCCFINGTFADTILPLYSVIMMNADGDITWWLPKILTLTCHFFVLKMFAFYVC